VRPATPRTSPSSCSCCQGSPAHRLGEFPELLANHATAAWRPAPRPVAVGRRHGCWRALSSLQKGSMQTTSSQRPNLRPTSCSTPTIKPARPCASATSVVVPRLSGRSRRESRALGQAAPTLPGWPGRPRRWKASSTYTEFSTVVLYAGRGRYATGSRSRRRCPHRPTATTAGWAPECSAIHSSLLGHVWAHFDVAVLVSMARL